MAAAHRWFPPWVKGFGFLRVEWIGSQSGADSASSGLSSELCGPPPGLIP